MSNFFENDNVRREMEDIYEIQKDLYNVIMQFPSMSDDAKWEHIETLKELLEKPLDDNGLAGPLDGLRPGSFPGDRRPSTDDPAPPGEDDRG